MVIIPSQMLNVGEFSRTVSSSWLIDSLEQAFCLSWSSIVWTFFFGGGGRGGGSTWTIQTILTKPALTILTNSRRNACYAGKFGQFYRIYHLFTLSLPSPSWPLKVSVTYLNDVTSWFCHFFVSLLSYSRVILIAASRTIMLLIHSWFQSDLLWRYEILFSHLIGTFHFTQLWVKVNECFKI